MNRILDGSFEPAVATLISEVIEDPSSPLFKWPGHSSKYNTSPPTKQQFAKLTETQLREAIETVQRIDLANLLRGAALIRLYSIPNEPHYLHRNLTTKQKVYIPDVLTWRTLARETLGLDSNILEQRDRLLLETCISDGLSGVSVSSLALASMRLQPTDAARIYLALDMSASGQPRTALHILRSVAQGPGGPLERSYAWEHIAFQYSQWDDYPQAIRASRVAAKLAPDRPDPCMNWLFNSCLAADELEISQSARFLDQMVCADDEPIREYAQIISDQAQLKQWNLSPRAVQVLKSVRATLGSASRFIVDAMLTTGCYSTRSGYSQRKGNTGIPPAALFASGVEVADTST
jgi:hypothetical protein